MRASAANSITVLRPLLVLPFAIAVTQRADCAAAVIYSIAAASDVADGWLARRLAVASERGRWLDHVSDIVFLVAAFAALWSGGAVPFIVPLSIAAAFAYYVVSSLRRGGGGTLTASRLGHFSGILNYVVLGVVVFDRALGGVLPPSILDLFFGAVIAVSATAVLTRFRSLQRSAL